MQKRRVVIDGFVFEIIKITNKGNLLLRPVGKLDAVEEIEIAKDVRQKRHEIMEKAE